MDKDAAISPTGSLALSAHLHGPSIDSTLNSSSSHTATTSTHSTTSKFRRGHGFGPSVSMQPEGRTPAEYAVHHLLNAFLVRADQKINLCLSNLETRPLPVEEICGVGADPAFDQLLLALGHVTRQKPRALVDILMFWRQRKADDANACRKQLAQHRSPSSMGSNLPVALPRRHTEPLQDAGLPHTTPEPTLLQHEEVGSDDYMLLDRQATASIFILCRGLMEVFAQSTMEAITTELALKLEDIVFDQLQSFEPHHLHSNKIRAANWRIYGQLLGRMSSLDFARVTNLYLQQLKIWQQDIASSAGSTIKAREVETRIELLLLSMQHIRLALQPTLFSQSCDFLSAVAQLFADSHGPKIKQAYCALFESLLSQVAVHSSLTENNPRFKDFVDAVNPRINQMLTKMRHWSSALPTSIALLCLSSMDVFHTQWMLQMNALSNKLRDRATRTSAMRAICQLTWAYLQRSTDSMLSKARKVEEIIRLVFPPGKKPHITTEASMAEAILCFVRLVGYHCTELCFRTIIFLLINPESIIPARDLRIEQLEPEKITIGIQSFLLVMEDKEKGSQAWPLFPEFHTPLPMSDTAPSSPMPFATSTMLGKQVLPKKNDFSTSTLPINPARLDEQCRNCFFRFCEVLGKITILCDTAFGSSATLNERFSAVTPKTPLAEAFILSKRDDGSAQDQRALYYDLLNVAIQALPRCMFDNVPPNTLINLLCTASAHVQDHVAQAATRSLKAIAGQGYAQSVAIAFPRFIFNYDHQYSTMSDDGRLGPNHIEATLALYLELLHIWVEQIQRKAKANLSSVESSGELNSARALQMEMTNALSLVDETEGYGLFFLCSQSRKVRGYAIKVLEIVRQFDKALGKDDQARIIHILDTNSEQILDIAEDTLTLLERSRLQRDKQRKGAHNVLIELSSSESYYDSALWFKAFPNLIRHIFEMCPNAVALSREVVVDRLALMQPDVERLAVHLASSRDFKLLGRSSDTPVNVFFDQWKLYLIMACVTLSSPGGQTQSQLATAIHTRKTSRNTSGLQDKLSSARALFSAVIPMLGVSVDALRSAVVTALGSINRKLYRILLESLQYAVITCNDEAKARVGQHQRTPSSPSRSQMTERMRAEVTCIYKLTAMFLKHEDVLRDEWILNNLMNYAKELRLFLSDSDVQSDWRFTKLRYHYCGLIEAVYININKAPDTTHWMSFEARKSAFTLMEDWCGYRSDTPGPLRVDSEHGDKGAIAKERSNLKIAALSAMAALCTGPVSVATESNTVLQFNIPRMLSWVDSVFAAPEHKLHEIGQKALKNLIVSNPNAGVFIEYAIQCCYGIKGVVALENCFNVIADILMQLPRFPISIVKVLGSVIFTLGHENREIRIKSSRLLRFLDEREQKKSNLQHFDISISDKTRAVYKTAQFEYSRRLAQTYSDYAFHVFSEFCFQFRNMTPDIQRNMVAAILPWLQTLELQISETNAPTDLSYMLLVNMVEITIQSSRHLHNEVQALWQALATGPYGGNVQLILDFIIELSLERREQNFVGCAKQIVVYLSTTPAGSKIFAHFLILLAPKNMPNERNMISKPAPEISNVPYSANLETILPMGNRQASLSIGQVAMIFLVDLLVPPVQLGQEDALRLLHTVFILWDHHTTIVQEHARELLVHLMHILIVTKMYNNTSDEGSLIAAEELVEAIRNNDPQISWFYADFTGNNETDDLGRRLPVGMSLLTDKVVNIFSTAFGNLQDAWAKESLHWASVCPVRHLACRSFQVFRCISNKLDSTLLSDMLARLSNTISDEHADYQTFSLEILTTLKTVIASSDKKELLKYPQLFWTTVACLNTIHEREFLEALGMLEAIVDRFEFSDDGAVDIILRARPADWDGCFEGVEPLIYKGLKSSDCLDRTVAVLSELVSKPNDDLLGKDKRVLFNTLAYLPWLLNSKRKGPATSQELNFAESLKEAARKTGELALASAIEQFSTMSMSATAFLINVLQSLKASFFPSAEADALIFVIGLLTNAKSWFRVSVLDILQELIPLVDIKNPNITNHGADLISPLLRLLQTEHCDQALKVMDLVIEVSSTPLERHHLRMSIASGPSRAIRKEYETTQSLYGIPELSGWSIPAPALHAAQTRNNVHHVFYMCSDTDSANETPARTPEVEFHAEEDLADSYFPPHAANETYDSFERVTMSDAGMGDIVSSLDSLDDFFEENESPTTPTAESRNSGLGSFSFFDGDHSTNVYDQQTAPILSRSFNRTSSSLSFHNGLADPKPSTSHQHRAQFSFSSAAHSYQNSFASIDEAEGPGPSLPTIETQSPVAPTQPAILPTRPGLHARSITSPANQYPVSHPTPGAAPSPMSTSFYMQVSNNSYPAEDVLSDSENTPFPTMAPSISHGGTKSVTVTPTSATDATANFMRRGMRRLTGGRSEVAKEKARLRAPSSGANQYNVGTSGSGQSPRIPRIPSEYLNNTAGNGNTPAGLSPGPLSPGQQS